MSKIVEKLSWQNIRSRAEPHRRFLRIWLVFIVVLSFLYVIIPVTHEMNWFGYYEPVKNGYVPFIDFHVGYPPLGFFLYLPYAVFSNFNSTVFVALMRITNGLFLSLSVLLTYLIVNRVRGQNDGILSALVIMFSISTISINTCSSESIALFFALLAVHFMLSSRAGLTGLFIGLGTMTKIFPGLLVVPAAKKLKPNKNRVMLLGSIVLVVLFFNLPFMIGNPFMWIGAYTFHGARGPWESVWALIEGWYGHGGAEVLHPNFEVFIPYMQLRGIYPPSPSDHAYFLWPHPWLSPLLLILSAVALLLSFFLTNENNLLEGTGLTLFFFMFFSKGYSPEFTIFLLPFVAMAFKRLKKIFLSAVFEIGTLAELIVWRPGMYSPNLLAFAIIMRTAAFLLIISLLILHLIRSQGAVWRNVELPKPNLAWFKDKSVAAFILSLLIIGISAQYLINTYSQFSLAMATNTRTANIKTYETSTWSLSNFQPNDRVLLNISSEGPTRVSVIKGNETIWASSKPQYQTKGLFIVDDATAEYSLTTFMAYPTSNFTIIDETSQDGFGKIEQEASALNLTLVDLGKDDVNSTSRLSWPMNMIVAGDFKVKVMYFQSCASRVILGILSITDGEVYEYEVAPFDSSFCGSWRWFEANSSSVTLDGHAFSDIRGDEIGAISVVCTVGDGENASLSLTNLEVQNWGISKTLDLGVKDTGQVFSQLYIAHQYSLENPTMIYSSYSALTISTVVAWFSLYKKFEKKTDEKHKGRKNV